MISTNIVEQDLVLGILAVFGKNGLQFVRRRMIWAACAIAQAAQIIRCPYSLKFSLAARTPYIRTICTDMNGFLYNVWGLFSMMSNDETQHKVSKEKMT